LKTGEGFSTKAQYLAVALTSSYSRKERETSVFKMAREPQDIEVHTIPAILNNSLIKLEYITDGPAGPE
jgi:hypothetical protein